MLAPSRVFPLALVSTLMIIFPAILKHSEGGRTVQHTAGR
jgi:hypothetical protein